MTLKFSRRMGEVYPKAIELVQQQRVDVDMLVTHRFELDDTLQAFAMQAEEAEGLIKSIIYPNGMTGGFWLESGKHVVSETSVS